MSKRYIYEKQNGDLLISEEHLSEQEVYEGELRKAYESEGDEDAIGFVLEKLKDNMKITVEAPYIVIRLPFENLEFR